LKHQEAYGKHWKGYGKRWEALGRVWEALGIVWEAYGKHEGGVGKGFFIMFNFSFGIIGTIWVLLGNFEIF
jgi:hypothetical protein